MSSTGLPIGHITLKQKLDAVLHGAIAFVEMLSVYSERALYLSKNSTDLTLVHLLIGLSARSAFSFRP